MRQEQNEPTFRRRVISGLLWNSVQNWATKLVQLALFALLARLLSPAEFGLFAAATAILAFVEIFAEQGLGEAIIQQREISGPQLNAAFLLNLCLAVVLYGVLWVAAPSLGGSLVHDPQLTRILRGVSVVIVLNAIGFTPAAMYARQFQYRRLAMVAISSTVCSGIVGASSALLGWGRWSLVAQSIALATMNAALLWWRPAWPVAWNVDLAGLWPLLRYGSAKLASRVVEYASTRYIELFIAATLGTVTLGFYQVGVRMYQALFLAMSAAVLNVAHNAFSRLAHDRPAIRDAYYQAIGISAAVAVPMFVMLAALAPEVTIVCFGEKWSPAAAIVTPVSLLGALQVLQFYNGTTFNALGKPSITFALNVAKTLLTILVLYLQRGRPLQELILWFVAAQALSAIPSFYVGKRMLALSFARVLQRVLPFLVASLAALLAVRGARGALAPAALPVFVQLLALGAVGSLVYVGAAFALGRGLVIEMLRTIRGARAARAASPASDQDRADRELAQS